jgi:hypothetical protein
MTFRLLAPIAVTTVFAALATPARLNAQHTQIQTRRHRHIGGAASFFWGFSWVNRIRR